MNTRCGRNTYYMSLGGQNFVELIVREFVMGQPVEYHEAYNPFLYCCVPAYVLKRSMDNQERLTQALKALPAALRARFLQAQYVGEDHAPEPDSQVQAVLLGHERKAAEVDFADASAHMPGQSLFASRI